GGGKPCRAAADNHNTVGMPWRCTSRGSLLALRAALYFLPHEGFALACLDSPTGHGIERGGAYRFSGAQAETGVVPRAVYCVSTHQPFGERSAIMGTGRSDREYLVAATGKQCGITPDMSADHASVGNIIERHALGEIGSFWF